MAACKDCIYFPMCKNIAVGNSTLTSEACEVFADKSLFVELPCKIGSTVYRISRQHGEWKILPRKVMCMKRKEWRIKMKMWQVVVLEYLIKLSIFLAIGGLAALLVLVCD